MAELEVRVETLEGTAADHETRSSAAESDVSGKIYNLLFNVAFEINNIRQQLCIMYN